MGTLKALFASAYAEGIIERDPSVSIIRPKSKKKTERRALTDQETENVLHTIQNHEHSLFLAVLYYLGLRRGEELAKRTFNPRLGVVGGLSVLGTTGVVRPMSEEALKETIRLELSVRKSQGAEEIGLVFGSQGERAANALFPCMQAVQMSNFVGFALDCAAELGFARATLLGQPGKLVKVSGGSMQTHSQYGDGRRETLIAHLALMGAPVELLEFVRQSVTLDGCISPIYDAGFDAVWTHLADAAAAYAAARIHGEMRVDAVMLDAKGQILGRSTSL